MRLFLKILNNLVGRKARLHLPAIMKPSNLLLDEPTNILISIKENLELAINNYKGSLLIIFHDRYFISARIKSSN